MNWRNKLRVKVKPNEVFGRLTVIKEIAARQHTPTGKVLRTIQCKCECGNYAEIPLQRLRSRATKSCGCLQKDSTKAANIRKTAKVISVGESFGRLLVVSEKGRNVSKGGSVKTVWNLMCDCGNPHTATTGSLTSGNVKSCGCLHSETAAKNGSNSRAAIINPNAGFIRAIGAYKSSAIKRGHLFELTESSARKLFESNCHYCGAPPSNVIDVSTHTLGPKQYLYNGIDRKDNSIGYVDANCVACCGICNHAKHTMPYEDFVSWVDRVNANLKRAIQEIDSREDDYK